MLERHDRFRLPAISRLLHCSGTAPAPDPWDAEGEEALAGFDLPAKTSGTPAPWGAEEDELEVVFQHNIYVYQQAIPLPPPPGSCGSAAEGAIITLNDLDIGSQVVVDSGSQWHVCVEASEDEEEDESVAESRGESIGETEASTDGESGSEGGVSSALVIAEAEEEDAELDSVASDEDAPLGMATSDESIGSDELLSPVSSGSSSATCDWAEEDVAVDPSTDDMEVSPSCQPSVEILTDQVGSDRLTTSSTTRGGSRPAHPPPLASRLVPAPAAPPCTPTLDTASF